MDLALDTFCGKLREETMIRPEIWVCSEPTSPLWGGLLKFGVRPH